MANYADDFEYKNCNESRSKLREHTNGEQHADYMQGIPQTGLSIYAHCHRPHNRLAVVRHGANTLGCLHAFTLPIEERKQEQKM